MRAYYFHVKSLACLGDGFALATAQARSATVATFDRRVRSSLPALGLELAAELS